MQGWKRFEGSRSFLASVNYTQKSGSGPITRRYSFDIESRRSHVSSRSSLAVFLSSDSHWSIFLSQSLPAVFTIAGLHFHLRPSASRRTSSLSGGPNNAIISAICACPLYSPRLEWICLNRSLFSVRFQICVSNRVGKVVIHVREVKAHHDREVPDVCAVRLACP